MIEEWKTWKVTPANNYHNHRSITYEISNFGNVKKNGKIKDFSNTVGYYKICGALLHRIVAELFIPNPENKPYIDHIDTNKHNNRIDNLRWVTQSENNHNTITWNRKTEIYKSDKFREAMRNKQLGVKMSDDAKRKMSLAQKGNVKTKGRIWINNGFENKMIYPQDIDKYIGYVKGICKK